MEAFLSWWHVHVTLSYFTEMYNNLRDQGRESEATQALIFGGTLGWLRVSEIADIQANYLDKSGEQSFIDGNQ